MHRSVDSIIYQKHTQSETNIIPNFETWVLIWKPSRLIRTLWLSMEMWIINTLVGGLNFSLNFIQYLWRTCLHIPQKIRLCFEFVTLYSLMSASLWKKNVTLSNFDTAKSFAMPHHSYWFVKLLAGMRFQCFQHLRGKSSIQKCVVNILSNAN